MFSGKSGLVINYRYTWKMFTENNGVAALGLFQYQQPQEAAETAGKTTCRWRCSKWTCIKQKIRNTVTGNTQQKNTWSNRKSRHGSVPSTSKTQTTVMHVNACIHEQDRINCINSTLNKWFSSTTLDLSDLFQYTQSTIINNQLDTAVKHNPRTENDIETLSNHYQLIPVFVPLFPLLDR